MTVLKRQADKVDVLAGVPLFEGLSKKELTELARRVEEVEFRPGEHLLVVGEPADAAYVILDGRATVRRRGRKIAEVTKGDVVGEKSLVTDLPRNAGVRADTFVPALRVRKAEFDSIMDDFPRVAVKVLRTVATRLVETIG
jgi:CRP/FNR family cyclic AMP-dependent transcriptional regulator